MSCSVEYNLRKLIWKRPKWGQILWCHFSGATYFVFCELTEQTHTKRKIKMFYVLILCKLCQSGQKWLVLSRSKKMSVLVKDEKRNKNNNKIWKDEKRNNNKTTKNLKRWQAKQKLNLKRRQLHPALILISMKPLKWRRVSNSRFNIYEGCVIWQTILWASSEDCLVSILFCIKILINIQECHNLKTAIACFYHNIPLPRLYSPRSGWNLQKISGHIGLLELPRDI